MNRFACRLINAVRTALPAVLCAACSGGPVEVVTEFPETRALTSEVWKIPAADHEPQAMVIAGRNLIIYSVKAEHLMRVYNLDTRELLYEGGEIGRGGNDFEGEPDRSTMRAAEDGFEIRVNREWYRVSAGPDELRIKEKLGLGDDRQPVAGALSLGDGLFCAENSSGGHAGKAFRFFDVHTGRGTYAVPFPSRQLKADVKSPASRAAAYSKHSVAHPSGDRMASFYAYYKAFQLISVRGDVLKTVRVDIVPFAVSFDEDSPNRFFAYISNPVTDGNLIYVLCAGSLEDKSYDTSATELQVFDWEGRPVASYELDHYVHHIAVDGRTVYAVNSLKPGDIYIYRL